MERSRWEVQNFQLGSSAPERRRRTLHLVLWHFCCCVYLQTVTKRSRKYQYWNVCLSRYFSLQHCRINICKLFLSSSVAKFCSLVVFCRNAHTRIGHSLFQKRL
jgi:hypothetical protein